MPLNQGAHVLSVREPRYALSDGRASARASVCRVERRPRFGFDEPVPLWRPALLFGRSRITFSPFRGTPGLRPAPPIRRRVWADGHFVYPMGTPAPFEKGGNAARSLPGQISMMSEEYFAEIPIQPGFAVRKSKRRRRSSPSRVWQPAAQKRRPVDFRIWRGSGFSHVAIP
jgi:hypothetical protein